MGCGKSLLEENSDAVSLSAKKDFLAQWRILRKLGHGSCAEVFIVEHKLSDRTIAMKAPKDGNNHVAKKEAAIWKKVGRHEHIVDILGDFVLNGNHVILMERCECTLSQRFPEMSGFVESFTARIFRQMTSAIVHLESLGIAHRDVKPDNFLCVGPDSTPKLCDFGYAKMLPASGELYGTCGTPIFMSPEMVGDGFYDMKTDVWSLGVSFYVMLFGEPPYSSFKNSAKTVMRDIAYGFPGPRFRGRTNVSKAAEQAVTTLLHRPMWSRVSATKALELDFLQKHLKPSPLKAAMKSAMASHDETELTESTQDLCSLSFTQVSPLTSFCSSQPTEQHTSMKMRL